jgi:hypothetical protein
MEQLDLNRELVELTLWGEVEKNSSIFELLYRYIKTVKISERPKGVDFSTVFSELPNQYHYSLFNQHLCE